MKPANFTKWNTKTNKLQVLFYPVIIVLMLITLLLIWFYIQSSKNMTVDNTMYQYARNAYIEYPEGVEVYSGEYSVLLKYDEQTAEADDTPLYMTNVDSFITMSDMMWIDVSLNKEWLIPELSIISMDDTGAIWCEIGNDKILLTGGVLYNIDGIYIALENGVVTWGGKKYLVTPLSFFTIDGDMTRVYQYEEKSLNYEEKKYSDIEFTADVGYSVLLQTGIYASSDGNRRLLAVNTMTLSNITEK
ncbi:MAG: hypothetical protein R3Y47_10925 [Lachnospiraceae bacterium]